MNTHTKIGVLAGLLLAIGAEQALAQMPGMPYMPYVKPATITLTQNQKYMLASIYDADCRSNYYPAGTGRRHLAGNDRRAG